MGDLFRGRAAVVIALGAAGSVTLTQHADEHRPEHPILLAVDQQFGEGAAVRVSSILGDVSPIVDV
jgi:hypothetical protein